MKRQLSVAVRKRHFFLLSVASMGMCVANELVICVLANHSFRNGVTNGILILCVWFFHRMTTDPKHMIAADEKAFTKIPRPALYWGSHQFEGFDSPATSPGFRLLLLTKCIGVAVALHYVVGTFDAGTIGGVLVALAFVASFTRAHYFLPLALSCVVLLGRTLGKSDSLVPYMAMVIAIAEIVALCILYKTLWEEHLEASVKRPKDGFMRSVVGLTVLASVLFFVLRPDKPSKKEIPKLDMPSEFTLQIGGETPGPAGKQSGNEAQKKKRKQGESAERPEAALGPGSDLSIPIPTNDGEPLREAAQKETKTVTISIWWLLLILVTIAALWFVIRRLRRKKPDEEADEEQLVDVEVKPMVKRRLQKQFKKGMSRVEKMELQTPEDRRQAVILLYQYLLARRRASGVGKRPDLTPNEYALQSLTADRHMNQAMSYVTDVFVKAKYRGSSPNHQEFDVYRQQIRLLGEAA